MQADPRWTPAIMGAARTLADENPPEAIALAKRALEINPSSVDAHVFLAEQAIDAARNGLCRRQAAGVRGRSGQDARDRRELRRRVPNGGRVRRAQLPVRRSRGA